MVLRPRLPTPLPHSANILPSPATSSLLRHLPVRMVSVLSVRGSILRRLLSSLSAVLLPRADPVPTSLPNGSRVQDTSDGESGSAFGLSGPNQTSYSSYPLPLQPPCVRVDSLDSVHVQKVLRPLLWNYTAICCRYCSAQVEGQLGLYCS
uniref:Uncharacterized protein n=1 Tax=Cacopsylla melanoneura TaxID=428564 RepID=A0A8D8RPX9_9HEMI